MTNYREPESYRVGAPSRGHLVANFLRGRATPEGYLKGLSRLAEQLSGRLDALKAELVFHETNEKRRCAQINIDGGLVEWKEY